MKMICPRCKNTHSERAPGKKNDNRCIPCVKKDQAAYYQANKEKFRGYRERARIEELDRQKDGPLVGQNLRGAYGE